MVINSKQYFPIILILYGGLLLDIEYESYNVNVLPGAVLLVLGSYLFVVNDGY